MTMKKIILLVALWLALNISALAAPKIDAQNLPPPERQANIQLELDSSSARVLLNLLSRDKVTDEELLRLVKLPTTQAMIRQAARFDPSATEANFKSSLRRVIETGSPEHDPFRFATVKARLEPVRSLLKQIEHSPHTFIAGVSSRLREYAPDNVALKSRVHFIVGGTSDGFAPSSDAFYIALHYYGDDYEGLKMLAAHELFHNLQAVLRHARVGDEQTPAAPLNVSNSFAILRNTVNEGTASMVGDALLLPSGKQYSDFLKAKYKKNLDRSKSNFALFEALLYRAYNDPGADYNQLYHLGFSGTWDSPLYFVGYRMGKVIEKYKGKEAIKASVGADPLLFFNQYVEIYKKENAPEIVRFSKSSEEILQKLQQARKRRWIGRAAKPEAQISSSSTGKLQSRTGKQPRFIDRRQNNSFNRSAG